MMLGQYFRNVDDKNRILLPIKFRNEFGSKCYITLGPDKNLEIRNAKNFEIFSNSLQKMNMLSKEQRLYARMILGNTHDIDFDKQGRMLLPESLLKSASISNAIVFVGVGNKIELFSQEKFDELNDKFEKTNSLDNLAEKLATEGIEI